MKSKITDSDYSVDVDKVSREQWHEMLQRFDDATLYQTWTYGAVRWGESNLSHIVLKKQNNVVAMAQLRIVRFPFLGRGIAYMTWGPVFQPQGVENHTELLRQVLRVLRQEYAIKRGLFLRLLPNRRDDDEYRRILEEEGFKKQKSYPLHRTLILDLSQSLEELKSGFSKKWRKNLKRAMSLEMEVLEGTEDDLYEVFIDTYIEMHLRKGFVEYVDVKEFREIQKQLPDVFKMEILICRHEGKPVSGLVYSVAGNSARTIFSATTNSGLKLCSSHFLRWRMLERLKDRGCRWFNQSGINKEKNPGGYRFKTGFGGDEVCQIGQFETCNSIISSIIIKGGDRIRSNTPGDSHTGEQVAYNCFWSIKMAASYSLHGKENE